MSPKNLFKIAALLVVLALSACLRTGVTEEALPEAVLPQGTVELEIISTDSFIDTYGAYTLVGEVINHGTGPATQVELTVELKDQAGVSLLTDLNGNLLPSVIKNLLLDTLAPGQSCPFAFTFDALPAAPASYSVVVSGFQLGVLNRPEMDTVNVQIIDNGSGWFYLSGDLLNQSNQWVRVDGLAGAVLDASGKVLSAGWSGTFSSTLAPAGDVNGRDRTPFLIAFANPGPEVSLWRVYWDATVDNSLTDYPIQSAVTNSYFDQYGSYHLVGWATNLADQPLTVMLVSGLSSESGSVVDASVNTLPVPIAPGASQPFNISSFSNVNFDVDQASLVRNHQILVDLLYTSPPNSQTLELVPEQEQVTRDVSTWLVSGSFTNSTDRVLRDAIAVVEVLDPQGNLVTSDYNYVLIEEPLQPGSTASYEVYLYLDPFVDASGFSASTKIYGTVSE